MIPEHVLAAATILVKRQPESAVASSFATLREYANLTQGKLARRLKVSRSAAANWETGQSLVPIGKTASIFRICGIPEEMISNLLKVDKPQRYDPIHYRDIDIDDQEHSFFQATRSQVLRKLEDMATNGDAQAIKLYKDWMERNEARIAARISGAIPVSDGSQSLRSLAIRTVTGRRRIKIEAQSVVGDTVQDETKPVTADNNETSHIEE